MILHIAPPTVLIFGSAVLFSFGCASLFGAYRRQNDTYCHKPVLNQAGAGAFALFWAIAFFAVWLMVPFPS